APRPTRTRRRRIRRWRKGGRPRAAQARRSRGLARAWLVGRRRDPDPRDAVLLELDDLQREAIDDDRLANRWDVPEMAQQEPGQGLVLAVPRRDDEAGLFAYLLLARPAGHEAGLARHADARPPLLDLADELLEDVLVGDDSREPPVFVDHRRELDPLPAHLADQRQEVF